MPLDERPQSQINAEKKLLDKIGAATNALDQTKNNNLKLGEAIKSVAAQNRKDGDINKTGYTDNVLKIREYQAREDKNMSGYAKEIAQSVEKINTENRKISKFGQRSSLKQLNQLQTLSESITDSDQKTEINKFIEESRKSVRDNTSTLSSMVSGVVNNMDIISAGMTSLFSDSPILALGTGFVVNKIKGAWDSKQEEKYAVQEAKERQLSEEMDNQFSQELDIGNLEESLAKLQSQDNKPEVVPTLPEQLSPELVKSSISGDSETWLEGMYEHLDDILMETMQISESVEKIASANSEESRRENAVYQERLLDALQSGKAELVNSDGTEKEGGLLGGLGMGAMIKKGKGFISTALMGIVRMLPKLLTKIFVPAMIIGSLFSGIMEAIDVYSETGSIKEAAIGFFGGVLDFVSFGFFGTDELNALIGTISEYTAPIMDAVMKPITWLKDKMISLGVNMIESLTKPLDMISELVDTITERITDKIGTMVDSLPEWAVPDSLIEWVADNKAPVVIESKIKSGNISDVMTGSVEADEREQLTEMIIKTNDELKQPTSNSNGGGDNSVNVVDNSNNSRTIIQKHNLTAHDPDLSLRYRFGGMPSY